MGNSDSDKMADFDGASFEFEISSEDMEKFKNLVNTGETAGNEYKFVFVGNPSMMGCGGNGCHKECDEKKHSMADEIYERRAEILDEAYDGEFISDEDGQRRTIYSFTDEQFEELEAMQKYFVDGWTFLEQEIKELTEYIDLLPLAPECERIIRSGDRTIVFWDDGDKTIVRKAPDEKDSLYAAFTAALGKKIYGNNSQLSRFVKKKTVYQEGKRKKKKKTPETDEQKKEFWANLGFTSCSTTTMKHEGETYAES